MDDVRARHGTRKRPSHEDLRLEGAVTGRQNIIEMLKGVISDQQQHIKREQQRQSGLKQALRKLTRGF